MTVLRLLGASLRAWYLVVMGMIVTAVAAAMTLTSPGVYYAQVDVVFLQPVNTFVPNNLRGTSADVTATAGVVQREVSAGRQSSRVVSESVTIVGEGIESGQRVTLPNSGGQWANNFERALLDVEVVDGTEDGARRRLDTLLASISEVLERRQLEAGAEPATWISTRLSPAVPTITYLEGERRRATVMTLVLGAGLTCSAVVLVESRRWTRRVQTSLGQFVGSADGRGEGS